MTRINFLVKLKEEGKLKLVKPSEIVPQSYLEKSNNSLKAAQLLFDSELYEESVSMSYYGMYHCVLALMFRCGIKCENHAASIILLERLFKEKELSSIISKAKEERIDKQYYVDFQILEGDAKDMMKIARDFTIQLKLVIEKLNQMDIEGIRERFVQLI